MTADDIELEERTPGKHGSAGGADSQRGRSRLGRALALRHWRVRKRLVAVILIPLVAAATLGGMRIASTWDSASDYERVEQLARLSEEATALTQELQVERDLVAGYIVSGRSGDTTRIDKQQQRVDARVAAVRKQARAVDDSYTAVLRDKVTAVRNRLQNLSAVRSTALETKLPAIGAVESYTDVISALLDVTVEISQSSDSSQLEGEVRALDALARAKEQVSQQRALMYIALEQGELTSRLHESFLEADAAEQSALDDFTATATVGERQLFEDTVTGSAVDQAARLEAKGLARADSTSESESLGLQPGSWFDTVTTKIDLMRRVERHMMRDVVSHSQALQTEARLVALRDAGVVLLVIFLALAIAVAAARSMTRPLRALRSSALDVAGQRLPDVVRQLQQSDGRHADVTVKRTSIDSDDEIGQVARAFDEVHEEAVRLATEQAALRGNVNAMFVNLSRRSQGLVERQLRLIDELENGEQDPDQLSSLFKLDHLATRMRRHGENLLVLAGEEPARRWGQPVPLLDVLRAAVSEVEQYERVELHSPPAAEISGRVVNDVVHLVAELLENATSYSSHDAKVLLTSERLDDDRVLVQISDSGIGMSADELAAANKRLATQPVVDVSVSRRMGLFVVGRLAWRHGIKVQLRASESGGVTALIMLSEKMVGVPAQAAPEPVSEPAPQREPAPQSAPQVEPAPRSTPQPVPQATQKPAPQSAPEPTAGPPLEPVPERQQPTPVAARVTRVPSRPVYGDNPATDPGMSPVQPHPAYGQGSRQEADYNGPPAPTPQANEPAGHRPSSGEGHVGTDGTHSGHQPTDSGSIFADVGSDLTAERSRRLPIFDEIQSEWFRQRTDRRSAEADPLSSPVWSRRTRRPAPQPEQPTRTQPISATEESSWQSPGDEAWRRAEQTISAPSSSGVTASGLPKRVPGSNFVPGSAGGSESGTRVGGQETAPSAETVGSRLASYHQGIRRGRHAGRHAADNDRAFIDGQREEENA